MVAQCHIRERGCCAQALFHRLKIVWFFDIGIKCLFPSEIWEDQVLGSGSEELCGGLRLGAQTLPQVHGLQGESLHQLSLWADGGVALTLVPKFKPDLRVVIYVFLLQNQWKLFAQLLINIDHLCSGKYLMMWGLNLCWLCEREGKKMFSDLFFSPLVTSCTSPYWSTLLWRKGRG